VTPEELASVFHYFMIFLPLSKAVQKVKKVVAVFVVLLHFENMHTFKYGVIWKQLE